MASFSTSGTGGGTTAVLGTRIVKGLATTGLAIGKVAWTAAAGLASIASGVVMLGRGRRVEAGEKLD